MILLDIKGKVTADDDKTNIVHKFDVPQGIQSLKIKYAYSPKILEDKEKAISIVNESLEKYGETTANDVQSYLPIKNLVTISVDENGIYRGAAHRQANEQEHILGKNFASPGFLSGEILAGEWDIVLNIHSVSCDVEYTVIAEGEEK